MITIYIICAMICAYVLYIKLDQVRWVIRRQMEDDKECSSQENDFIFEIALWIFVFIASLFWPITLAMITYRGA